MAIDGRLLAVIESINDLGVCTIVDIHRATGISRPSIHRIVESLCEYGYTERVNGSSAIRLTSQILALSAGYRPENRLADIAAPVLATLQQRLRWPLSFATPLGDVMVIQETTRDQNPFVFDGGRTGLRLEMLTTAIGCAYLASCGIEEKEAAFGQWRCSNAGGEDAQRTLAAARHRIDQAHEMGFALRRGGAPKRTTSIAVSVVVSSTPVGALCTTFPTSAVPLSEACMKYVPELKEAAKAIALSCEGPVDTIPPGERPRTKSARSRHQQFRGGFAAA